MKGQYLFVRPAAAEDHGALDQLVIASGYRPQEGSDILIGKLAGSCVAALYFDTAPASELVLCDLIVAPELRRKHIGTGMLAELERLGRSLGKTRIRTHSPSCPFFMKAGFTLHGDVLQRAIEGE